MTSRPRRRSTGSHGKPIKRVDLKLTAKARKGGELERSASNKGIAFQREGDDLSFSVVTDSPEEALAKLKLLGELFSSRGLLKARLPQRRQASRSRVRTSG